MRDFKFFYDDSPFGLMRADAAGCATYANRAWGEITGRDVTQLLGLGWADAIHVADRQEVLQAWRMACGAELPLDVKFRLLTPDGFCRFLRLRSRALVEEGAATDYMAVLLDLTDQVIAEQRLRQNNELLNAVLESIPCGITAFDAEGRLVLENKRVRSSLHLSGGPHDQANTGLIDRGLDTEPCLREEIQPDGRVFEVRDAPMPTGGLVTTYTDVTQQKHYIDTLEQAKSAAEQALKAKAAFLATMSHEIRTPMNGVIGMTSILLESRLSQDQREVVEVIRQSGESLLVVINDILDYSKIESGQMELEWSPLRLQEVVDNCLLLLSPRAQEKGVSLTVEVDPHIPGLILGDRTRLQQVLVNLISNAVKFTSDGEVRITLANSSREVMDGPLNTGDPFEIRVCISDSGIGIPQEKLEAIFEPFVQADSSTARVFGGTGLGLAIARRLVHAMDGTLSLESEVGVGTRVCVTFMAEASVPRARTTAQHQIPLYQRRVLLVTGTRADVEVLHMQLGRWGMEVELCAKPSDARTKLARRNGFDLVVAANHMSEARWSEFVRNLRDHGVGVPAVLLSRNGALAASDAALGARTIARASTEADLYDALADALQEDGDSAFSNAHTPQFDDSLGHAVPLDILVAEDNEINRKVVLRMLAGFGYEADIAKNGAEVIEAVQARNYDLVLMDIQMPKVDGIEATKFIMRNLPPARRPRVVAMSANVMSEDVAAALAAGADHYIAKPFPPAQIRAALQQSALRSTASSQATDGDAPQLLAPHRLRCHLVSDPTGRFLKELCRDFIQTSADLEGRLNASIRSEDVAQVRTTVHEYAGMCAVVGAQHLTEVLGRLQKIARAGSVKGTALLLQQCAQVREQTIAVLESAVQENAGRGLANAQLLARTGAGPKRIAVRGRR